MSGGGDLITEAAQGLKVAVEGAPHSFGIDGFSRFDEGDSLVEDLPDDLAEPVGDSPNKP